MDKLSINKITNNFFRTGKSQKAETKKIEGHQTNPFGISFKGNVLTADVFEKKKSDNLIERASIKSKMLSSAVVASFAKLNSSIGTRLNSVVSFGNKVKENASGMWNQAKSIEITFDVANIGNVLKSKLAEKIPAFTGISKENKLGNMPVADLEAMLTAELAKV